MNKYVHDTFVALYKLMVRLLDLMTYQLLAVI